MYQYEFEKRKLYNYLGEELVDLLRSNRCILAGGAITSIFNNRDINDVDIYFRSLESLEELLEDIWGSSKWIVSQTDKALLMKYNELLVQLIYFNVFDKVEDIFKTFDFTVCMGAFDFEKEEFILHKDFFKHNCEKILKFNEKTSFPIMSMLRVQKYEDKGYSISKPEFIRILLACMNMKINTYDELKKQLGGMYGVNYDKYFKEIENEEFSLEKVMKILENLIYDKDYFKQQNKVSGILIENIEDVLVKIEGYKLRYFKTIDGLETYKVTRSNKIKYINISNIPDKAESVNAEELFKNIKIYKFVKKTEQNKYLSFYNNKFEYKIGETATAINMGSYWKDEKPCLYGSFIEYIEDTTYSNSKNKALLELQVDYKDFITGDDCSVKFTKCKVLREVPIEEYERYLNKN